MKKLSILLAYIDILFNLLIGITICFIVAFLMIHPPLDTGQIEPPVKLMITMEWDDKLEEDIDLWVRGYDGTWIGFNHMDGNYMVLERDDRGAANDVIIVNGVETVIERNYEVANFSVLPAGEYFINVHYYSTSGPSDVEVHIKMSSLSPYKLEYDGKFKMGPDQERTFVSFVVDEHGDIVDLNTDIQMKLIHPGNGPGRRDF